MVLQMVEKKLISDKTLLDTIQNMSDNLEQ